MDVEEKDIKIITDMYQKYWKYMIGKDEDGLRKLMADDYALMHMTGVRQSVDEFIRGLLGGTFNYYSAEHDEITVRIDGDTATMIGKSRVVAAVYGGDKNKWKLQGDFTLRKEKGAWKFTSSKESTY